MHTKQTLLIRRLGYSALGLIFLSLLLIGAILSWSSYRMNQTAIESADRALDALIRKDFNLVKAASKDLAWWSQTIDNVVEQQNRDWLKSNFGQYLVDTYHISHLYILSAEQQLLYRERAGVEVDEPVSAALLHQLQPLFLDVQNSSWVNPMPESRYIQLDDKFYFGSVAAITPDGLEEEPSNPPLRALMVFLRELNQELLDTWQNDASLQSLDWHKPSQDADQRQHLKTPSGEILATLYWSIELPSSKLIADSIPLLCASMIAILGMGLLINRQFRRALNTATQSEIEKITHRNNETHFRGLADQAPVLIWITTVDGRLTFINQQAKNLFQNMSAEDIQEQYYTFIHPSDRKRLQRWFLKEKDNWEFEFRIAPAGKEYHWISARSAPHHNAKGEFIGYLFSGVDISDKKNAEELIWQQANYDELTHLPNRHLLLDRLDSEIKRASRQGDPIAVIYIDLDHFKNVNDTQGHKAGDMLLVEAAQRINHCLRQSDTAARLGGDEFVIIIPKVCSAKRIESIAQRIIDKMHEPFIVNGIESRVSASIGVSLYPDDGLDSDTLLMNADTAMYNAKAKGRDGISYFQRSMNVELNRKITLELELRKAINNQEFYLQYQPIIDIQSRRLVGAEALLRWQHPSRGFVGPDEFIPILESSRLICELEAWLFDTAIAQLKAWQHQFQFDGYIAINVSSAQFLEWDPSKALFDSLEKHNCQADKVQVEITESLFLDDAKPILEILGKLQKRGIKLALDDFGTGYSSLSYLNSFNVDVLKIDKSFISLISSSTESASLVGAILAIASSLDLVVVAEGIETEEQHRFLADKQCQRGQGYLYNKPLDALAFGRCYEAEYQSINPDVYSEESPSLSESLKQS